MYIYLFLYIYLFISVNTKVFNLTGILVHTCWIIINFFMTISGGPILKQMEIRGNITTRLETMQCICRIYPANNKNKIVPIRHISETKRNIGTIWVDCKWSENKILKMHEEKL